MLDRIHWLGHATFRINGGADEDGSVVYIDPWRLPAGSPPADVILISHDHPDHFSPMDIAAIHTGETLIFGSQRVAERADWPVQMLRPWQAGSTACRSVCVRAVPAYTPSYAYHAKSYGGLGFIISMMLHDIYYAGDTELIPEMEKIGCDIALLPVGGAHTMTPEEAVEAAKLLKPRHAVPMHYGREIPGSRGYGRQFVQMLDGDIHAVELELENDRLYIA